MEQTNFHITTEFWDFIEQNVPDYHTREDVLRQCELQNFIDGHESKITGLTREEAITLRDQILFRLYHEAIDSYTRRTQFYRPPQPPYTEENLRGFMEVVANIAYDAGCAHLRIENDSVGRIGTFVQWALEFNCLHNDADWDEEDFISVIGQFIDQKIAQYQKPLDMSCPNCGQHSIKSEVVEGPDAYYALICEECGCRIEGDKAQKLIEKHIRQ